MFGSVAPILDKDDEDSTFGDAFKQLHKFSNELKIITHCCNCVWYYVVLYVCFNGHNLTLKPVVTGAHGKVITIYAHTG